MGNTKPTGTCPWASRSRWVRGKRGRSNHGAGWRDRGGAGRARGAGQGSSRPSRTRRQRGHRSGPACVRGCGRTDQAAGSIRTGTSRPRRGGRAGHCRRCPEADPPRRPNSPQRRPPGPANSNPRPRCISARGCLLRKGSASASGWRPRKVAQCYHGTSGFGPRRVVNGSENAGPVPGKKARAPQFSWPRGLPGRSPVPLSCPDPAGAGASRAGPGNPAAAARQAGAGVLDLVGTTCYP
jgi:hypothetical protein